MTILSFFSLLRSYKGKQVTNKLTMGWKEYNWQQNHSKIVTVWNFMGELPISNKITFGCLRVTASKNRSKSNLSGTS